MTKFDPTKPVPTRGGREKASGILTLKTLPAHNNPTRSQLWKTQLSY